MVCPNCGKQIPDQSRFCGICGCKLTDDGGADRQGNTKSGRGRSKLWIILLSIVAGLVVIDLILFAVMKFRTKRAEPSEETTAEASEETEQTQTTDGTAQTEPEEGSDYEFRVETCTWTEAFEKAKAAGGRLASFDSREEYDAVIAQLDEAGLRKTEFRLGARRDENGTDYRWVDENGEPTGEVVNDPASWTDPLWAEGEPTFQWQEYTETTLVLYFDEGAGRWCLNDIPNEPYGTDRYGYIIAYDTAQEVLPAAEAQPGSRWLGTWTADSGECIDISAVTDTGLSCTFYKQDEAGGWIEADYEMEFDDASGTTVSERGGPEDHGGWEYRFVLEHGYLTVESRYPNQAFYQAPAAISDEDRAALENFLTCFSCYNDDYDCRLAATAKNSWGWTILESVTGHPYCVSGALYPGEDPQNNWNQTDPLGRWESHAKFSEAQVHWILKNILNCTDADVSSLKNQLVAASDEMENDYAMNPYYLDGYYYRGIHGIGWEIGCMNPEVTFDGTYYLVKYDLGIPGYSVESSRCAVMRLKTIGGEKYWSLYYDGTDFPEDMDFSRRDEATPAEPEQSSQVVYTQDDMNATAQTFGRIKLWEYHDYDGDGAYEAFFLTVDPESSMDRIDKIYFIDSSCAVTLMADDIDVAIYDSSDGYYRECRGKGFFWGNFGGYGSGHSTFLFSVKNGVPYELDISRNLQGFLYENGAYYTTGNDFSAGFHQYPKYELLYDEENQQFVQGAKVSDDALREG